MTLGNGALIEQTYPVFYPSSPLAKLYPLGRGAGPRQQTGSPSSVGPARRPHPELRRWQAWGDQDRARSAHSPRPRMPEALPRAPRSRRPEGPWGTTPSAEGPRATRTSPPWPVATAFPPGAYPRAVVAHHHLPALAVHRLPGREPPPPPNDLQPLLPGPFLFLLLPRGPSFGPTFFPQPEVTARPHPPFKILPARKGWGWVGGGRDRQ